ncbi:hypothetical protein VTN77DRAFT_179 [Rasamsonia byssochlamydoides]|uniref:uncharacterized protein n=1 Tax=Rasamsonia byssochlamydoides TaxID=89139 RepID=UPI0037429C05
MFLQHYLLIITHMEEKRKAWTEQFTALQQGQSYFLKVVSQVPDSEYLQSLLVWQRTSWLAETPQTPTTKAIFRDAVIRCGLWVQRKVPKSGIPLYPAPFITAKEMQGYPIGIKDDGEFQLRWRHPTGLNKSLLLNARFAVSRTSREIRALSFTEHGLDNVDSNGNPHRPSKTWSGEASKASIPRSMFAATSPGQLLIDLWMAVRQEYGHDIDKTDNEQSRKWGPKG